MQREGLPPFSFGHLVSSLSVLPKCSPATLGVSACPVRSNLSMGTEGFQQTSLCGHLVLSVRHSAAWTRICKAQWHLPSLVGAAGAPCLLGRATWRGAQDASFLGARAKLPTSLASHKFTLFAADSVPGCVKITSLPSLPGAGGGGVCDNTDRAAAGDLGRKDSVDLEVMRSEIVCIWPPSAVNFPK